MSEKIKKDLLNEITDDPKMRAFFNQQMSLLEPYLLQKGTCGIQVEVPNNKTPDTKRVRFFYTLGEDVIEASAEGSDLISTTIQAREDMTVYLNQIINHMSDVDDDMTDRVLH